MLWKKIIVKGSITNILYINTKILKLVVSWSAYPDYSVLVHPWNVEKMVSLKSFRLSVETLSRFSRLSWFNWVWNKDFTSFVLEKNLWTQDKLDSYAEKNHTKSHML